MQNQTDRELIVCCLQESEPVAHPPGAWPEFDRRFRPRMIAGIRRGLACAWERPQPDLLEELLQECYCRLLEHDRRVLRRCLHLEAPQIGSYLVKVGRSVALDWLRRRGADKRGHGKTHAVDHDWLAELGSRQPTAERKLSAAETLASFWSECSRMMEATGNHANLEVLRQAWIDQRPSREIAADVGVATSTVDSLVCRMRRRLAERGWDVAKRN